MRDLKNIFLKWRFIFTEVSAEVWRRHLLFFLATFVSMTWTYYFTFSYADTFAGKLAQSLAFSVTLVIILLSHEMGHYINARQYGVMATLPYFIPMPFFSPFGTMGAFIRMKSMPPDKRALFDISYWGPAMSFFTSIPAIIIGLLLSVKYPIMVNGSGFLIGKNNLVLGSSMLFDVMIRIFTHVPDGYTLVLHPLAYAGWVGLFVTAINLFPIGQLDGGHIAYVFLGKRQKYIAYAFFGILVCLALFVSPNWTFWIFMLFLMGLRHPPNRIIESGSRIDSRRIRQGIFAAVVFILCFIPEPIKIDAIMRAPKNQNMDIPDSDENYIQYVLPEKSSFTDSVLENSQKTEMPDGYNLPNGYSR